MSKITLIKKKITKFFRYEMIYKKDDDDYDDLLCLDFFNNEGAKQKYE